MSYLKGKDIKQHGNCLANCYKYRIEVSMVFDRALGTETFENTRFCGIKAKKPEGFENIDLSNL